MTGRYITLWRMTGENCLDWDFHVSEDIEELRRANQNLVNQSVLQISNYHLGERIDAIGDLYKEAT